MLEAISRAWNTKVVKKLQSMYQFFRSLVYEMPLKGDQTSQTNDKAFLKFSYLYRIYLYIASHLM